jgi:hypothetical protein
VFKYTKSGSHNLSNLIGSSNNEPQSHGKLNVTYAYCWWDNVKSRCPRTRYGKIHVLNCYYNNVDGGIAAGKMSNIRAEGCYFEDNVDGPAGTISTGGSGGVFVIDCNRGSTKAEGMNEAFTPPYEYKKYNNSEVKSLVTNSETGAGATLGDPAACEGTRVDFLKNRVKAPSISVKVTETIRVSINLKRGDKAHMRLLTLTGHEITGKRSVGGNAGITTAALDGKNADPGLYILHVNINGRSTTRKIVKTR